MRGGGGGGGGRAPPWRRWELFRAAYALARPGAVRDLRWRWLGTAASAGAEVDAARFVALAGALLGLRAGESAAKDGQRLARLLAEIFAALAGRDRRVVDLRELVVGLVILHGGADGESNVQVREFLWHTYDVRGRGWLSGHEAAALLWSLASSERSARRLAQAMQTLEGVSRVSSIETLLPDDLLTLCRAEAQFRIDQVAHGLRDGIQHAHKLRDRTQGLQAEAAIRHMQGWRLRASFVVWRARAQRKRLDRAGSRKAKLFFRVKRTREGLRRLRAYAEHNRGYPGLRRRAITYRHARLVRFCYGRWLAWHDFQTFKRALRTRAFAASYRRGFRHLERAQALSRAALLERSFWTWQNLWAKAIRAQGPSSTALAEKGPS